MPQSSPFFALSAVALAPVLCLFNLAVATAAEPHAEIMPMAHTAMALDVTQAGDRLVAVGERGHILLSDDYGRSWSQAPAPTRATLTAVAFPSPQSGWAVGHRNTILHSNDHGQSWHAQSAPASEDDVFLDVLFINDLTGWIVGAYGVAFATTDGGQSWQPFAPIDDQLHFNAIVQAPDGRLLMAMETGLLLASGDNGASWDTLPSPYNGSLFGVLPLNANTLLTFGLRGNAFRSTNGGLSWSHIPLSEDILITHATQLANGHVLLVGMNGHLFLSTNAGRAFSHSRNPKLQGPAAILATPDGAVVTAGLSGLHRLQPPTR